MTTTNDTTRPTCCPHCGKELKLGALMGMRNLGRKKNYTPEQREHMRQQLAAARELRWPHKLVPQPAEPVPWPIP